MKTVRVGFKNNAMWLLDKVPHGGSFTDGMFYNAVVDMTEEQFAFLELFIKGEGYLKTSITEIYHTQSDDTNRSIADYGVYLYKDNSIKRVNPIQSDNQVLNFKYAMGGVKEVFPAHHMVSNWLFTENTEDEATLANAMAVIAEKSGMGVNDLQHLFPAVLRMLKNDTIWSGQSKIKFNLNY